MALIKRILEMFNNIIESIKNIAGKISKIGKSKVTEESFSLPVAKELKIPLKRESKELNDVRRKIHKRRRLEQIARQSRREHYFHK